MIQHYEIKTSGVSDRIKQTLGSTAIPVYDWMLDTGLHQCDLLVYAAIFDILRHEPLTPQRINLSEVARRIHYTRQSVYNAVDMLVEHKFLFSQGSGNTTIFSLSPFDTLDLK